MIIQIIVRDKCQVKCKYVIEHLEMKYRCTFNSFKHMTKGLCVIWSLPLFPAQLSVSISRPLSCVFSLYYLRLSILSIKAL